MLKIRRGESEDGEEFRGVLCVGRGEWNGAALWHVC